AGPGGAGARATGGRPFPRRRRRSFLTWRSSAPAADLVDVLEKIRRILVDPVCAGPHELVLAVASGEQPYAERTCTPRGEHVPHAIADDTRARDGVPEQLRRREKQVGVRFRVFDHVAGDDRRALAIDP